MHRIIEAFTRPHYAVSAVDDFIIAFTVITVILLIAGVVALFLKR